jgi:hypothetical protein
MTLRAEVAAIHKAALRRNRPSLIRSYVVRILGGQSLMLGNAATNANPTTFEAGTCRAFNLTDQETLVPVTTGASYGVLGETRLGAACPAIDYAKRRNELLGENSLLVQLAWSGSAVLATSPNGISPRWDPNEGESSFLTSRNLVGFPPSNRIDVMENLRNVVSLHPKMDIGDIEFHWQQGPGDASAIFAGTSSASDYRAALDRIRAAVKANYGVGRFFVWADGWVVGSEEFRATANAKHAVIHPLEDDFVASHGDVIFATTAFRDVLSGNFITNGNGEWVSGGLDGFIEDNVHPNADFVRAIARRAAADIAYADGVAPAP